MAQQVNKDPPVLSQPSSAPASESASSHAQMDLDTNESGLGDAMNGKEGTQANSTRLSPNGRENNVEIGQQPFSAGRDAAVKQEPINSDLIYESAPVPAPPSSTNVTAGPSRQRISVTPTRKRDASNDASAFTSPNLDRNHDRQDSAMSISPAKSNASSRSKSGASYLRPAPTFITSRNFAPLPADPPVAASREGTSKRSERKSKTDALSAIKGKDGTADANPPTSAQHPSHKPLGPLTATYAPLPLYAPAESDYTQWHQNGHLNGDKDVKMNGLPASAPAATTFASSAPSSSSAIPTHHNTPRIPPPRQRPRLFELPEAPTFYPTPEEFADPLKYIKWIGEPDGGNGKAYGIVKVVPPEGWNPTFVLDQERFRFRTRVQRLNSLSADARASLNYQEQLQKFHAQQGHARVSIPVVDRRPVDLYQLKLVVATYGGYDAVARQRKWAEVTRRLGYEEKESCHLAAQIKAAYSRIIYPFEHFLEANRDASKRSTAPTAASAAEKTPSVDERGQSVDAPTTPNMDEDGQMIPDSAASAVTAEDGDDSLLGNMRRRSSRRKTDPRDAATILSARGARGRGQPSPPPHGTNGDFYIAPGAEEQMCEICLRGDNGTSMLLCDECNRGFHMYCLDPPLTAIPRSEWYCPPCLVGTGNDYGFDDGETHSLSSFWKRADAFRSSWWSQRAAQDEKENDQDEKTGEPAIWRPENGKSNGVCRTVTPSGLQISEDDVEREFWRLVHNPDETVEVEYGADVHSTTHGSALPTLETHPLDPYSRDGWNLNNLPILNGSLLRYIKSDISGMTVPWVYVGMMFSTFCWHNEDHYTYSINYQHFGDTKTWYGIPGSDAHKLENALRKAAPDLFEQSPDLLFQLVTMMSPDKLRKEGVNVYAIDQRANEFVITFPKAYHSGFNQGFNLNEAVNFALPDWIDMDLECIRRYQQYKRFPVFSHDELLTTVYQHSQTVDTAMWLQNPMREMVERETAKRDRIRTDYIGIAEQHEDVDLTEAGYQCSHCNIFCFLGQIVSPRSEGVACLDHGMEVCKKDMPSEWTLRLRFSDEQLRNMLSKTVERACVPANWQARLQKVVVASARPPLRSLRGLLHEGEKIPYPIAEMDELRDFVEKANRWVDEATAFIAKRHQKRAATATGKELSGRRGKRLSRATDEDESMIAADEVEQLGEPEKMYVLLTEAELLPFDAPEISALHGVVEQMEEFKHRAKELLTRIKTAKTPPKLSECEEVISLGSPLSVKLKELDAIQTYVNRHRWLSEIEEARNNFFTLEEVESYIEEGRSVGVMDDDEHLRLLQERKIAGLRWKERAESVLDYTSREVKRHACNWRLDDVERLTKASYEVAIVPELHLKLEQLLKHVKDLAKQSTNLLSPVERKSSHSDPASHLDDDDPVTRRYVEAKRFLDQTSSINVVIEGEGELAYRVAQHDRWQDYYRSWLLRSRLARFNAEEVEDPINCLALIRKQGDRIARINDFSEREPDTSKAKAKCFCRSDEATGAAGAVCSICDSMYHAVCLGLAPNDVKGRKAKTFVCPFCNLDKLPQLLSAYVVLPDIGMMGDQMPRVPAPFGLPEAHQAIYRAQDEATRFEAELNSLFNFDFKLDSRDASGYNTRLRLVLHLLKRALAIDFANLRIPKYNRAGVKLLSEILFAHKGLGPEGQTVASIPWRGIAVNDPRFAPNAKPYNAIANDVKQEISSSPITQPSPIAQSRAPAYVLSSPHAYERSLGHQPPPPQAHHGRAPLLPPSYGGGYASPGPVARNEDPNRPMLPLPMHYSMRYEQQAHAHSPPSRPPPQLMRPSYQYAQSPPLPTSFRPTPASSQPLQQKTSIANVSLRDSSPQAAPSPNEDDGKDDGRKRKRGKRARFVFQEEVGIFVPVNGENIYCLCRRGESDRMISCDRCSLWFHYACVHIESAEDLGNERWICPMCCVKTERRYPFGEVKVKEIGVSDPTLWLDVRATLRSTRSPVSKLQHWTVGPEKRIVLHLESFYPATLPSAHEGRDGKRQRSDDGEGVQGRVRSGSQGSASSSTATANANALGSVSRMPSWNDVRARITPVNSTPSAKDHAERMQREAEERHRQGMANLYSRGVTDAMIQRWYVGWNGKELVYPHYDRFGNYHEISLGTHVDLARNDPDGSQFIESILDRRFADHQTPRQVSSTSSSAPRTMADGAQRAQVSPRPSHVLHGPPSHRQSPKSAAQLPPPPVVPSHTPSPQTALSSLPPTKLARQSLPMTASRPDNHVARPTPPITSSPLSAVPPLVRPPPPRPISTHEEGVKSDNGKVNPLSRPSLQTRSLEQSSSPQPSKPLPLATPSSQPSVRPPVVGSGTAAAIKRSAYMVPAIPPFRASANGKSARPGDQGRPSMSAPSPTASRTVASAVNSPSQQPTMGERFGKSPSLSNLNVTGVRSPMSASPQGAVRPLPSFKQQGTPPHSTSIRADNTPSAGGNQSVSSPLRQHNSAEAGAIDNTVPSSSALALSNSPTQKQKSPEEFRAIARMMKPGATEAEIEEMVRQAIVGLTQS